MEKTAIDVLKYASGLSNFNLYLIPHLFPHVHALGHWELWQAKRIVFVLREPESSICFDENKNILGSIDTNLKASGQNETNR